VSADLVAVSGLSLRLGGRLVLDVPQLAVREGEVLALMGPNGAGKSMLLQSLGLLQPAAMDYWFAGGRASLPRDGLALRRQMAVVFQEPLLLNARVFDNVALGLRLRDRPRREIEDRVGHWLERLGVAALARRPARALSGGEAQRVSLARALVVLPRLLLLDEPFAGLDALTRGGLVRDLRGVLAGTGTTAVFATHDFLEALVLADRVAVLDQGRVVQLDRPQEVYRRPASSVVHSLVQAVEETVQALTGGRGNEPGQTAGAGAGSESR
jgi:tungstate transport system ATP-binding protein